MSTSAVLLVQDPYMGTCKGVMVNFDGGLTSTGLSLYKYYNSLEKALELIEMGSIRGLGSDLESTEFYHRDYESDLEVLNYHHFEFDLFSEMDHIYLFRDGCWHHLKKDICRYLNTEYVLDRELDIIPCIKDLL